ncbi:MAG: hypothetical protein MRZ45_05955 [Blautia sp.]|nr:hypothetical protein [Blautia sp.]MDY4515164.1 hypothetical protein [Lachnospiraceae bacterium]
MNSFVWTLSFVLMIGGGIAVAASAMSRSYAQKQQKYKGRAVATVVEIVADEPDRKGQAKGIHDYFYAVFAYYADGRLYKKRYEKGGNPCPFVMNERIEIQYDTENPGSFMIHRKTQMNYLSLALYYGGMCVCLAGGALFLMAAMRIL